MFFEIIVLKKLQMSQENTSVGVFFNKVASPQNCNFIKEELQQVFSCEICEILKSALLYRKSPVVAYNSFKFPACNFIKKRLWQRCFSMNFGKFLKISFDRTSPDDCFLCLSENFEKFPRSPIL